MDMYSDVALSGNGTAAAQAAAHGYARGYAETGMYAPNTKEFKAAFDKAVTTPISEGGAGLPINQVFGSLRDRQTFTPISKW